MEMKVLYRNFASLVTDCRFSHAQPRIRIAVHSSTLATREMPRKTVEH